MEKAMNLCPRCRGNLNLNFKEEPESPNMKRRCSFCGKKYFGKEYETKRMSFFNYHDYIYG